MGESGTFSSGYWDDTATDSDEDSNQNTKIPPLTAALERNMEILARKLDLRPGMILLDVGCGTGQFSKYISANFDGVRVVGVNNSKEEVELARVDVGPNVQFILGDYQSLLPEYTGKFHRVVCLHILEHIGGPKNYHQFFHVVSQYLRPDDGRVLIQNVLLTKTIPLRVDLFMRKYLLRQAITPYTSELLKELLNGFHIDSVESTGAHYRRTLVEYRKNLRTGGSLKNGQFEDEYEKVMDLALRLMVLIIEMRRVDVWQITASRFGEVGIGN